MRAGNPGTHVIPYPGRGIGRGLQPILTREIGFRILPPKPPPLQEVSPEAPILTAHSPSLCASKQSLVVLIVETRSLERLSPAILEKFWIIRLQPSFS